MNKDKLLVLLDRTQLYGTIIGIVGLATLLFISFVPSMASGLVSALGAVIHVTAMLCGIKMDDGFKPSREHVKR